jgi:hypothetical protein
MILRQCWCSILLRAACWYAWKIIEKHHKCFRRRSNAIVRGYGDPWSALTWGQLLRRPTVHWNYSRFHIFQERPNILRHNRQLNENSLSCGFVTFCRSANDFHRICKLWTNFMTVWGFSLRRLKNTFAKTVIPSALGHRQASYCNVSIYSHARTTTYTPTATTTSSY